MTSTPSSKLSLWSSGWLILLISGFALLTFARFTPWLQPLLTDWKNLTYNLVNWPTTIRAPITLVTLDASQLSTTTEQELANVLKQHRPHTIVWPNKHYHTLLEETPSWPLKQFNLTAQPSVELEVDPTYKTHWYQELTYQLPAPTTQNDVQNLELIHHSSSKPLASLELLVWAQLKQHSNLRTNDNASTLFLDTGYLALNANGSVWLPETPVEIKQQSLADYLLNPTKHNVILFATAPAQATDFVSNITRLYHQQQVTESNYTWVILALGLIVALLLFNMTISKKLWVALGFLITLLVALGGWQWFELVHYKQWLPLPELLIAYLGAFFFALMEKRHQRPFFLQKQELQVLLLETAEMKLHSGQLEQSWELLTRLPDSEAKRSKSYDLAQQCERKRDFHQALLIYQDIEKSQKNYKDCQQKIESIEALQKQALSMSASASMDKTLIMSNDDLLPPSLGRYQIERVLGSGAMGVVYEGIDPAINRQVAIKTLALSNEFSGDAEAEARARFFREAETAGKLKHPNIVTIYDVGEDHELSYIAMDFLTGAPLDQYIQFNRLLPIPLIYQLMIQITSALAYAHQEGVVHRDIKPANIVYDDEQQKVIVTDFGIACLTDNSKTKTGAILGSPYYMSPEQVRGEKVDGRSDQFSLAITFYQLLTGELPFNGESIATVALQISSKKHEPIRKLRPELPASASRIINKALQKDKTKRYQSMEEMRQTLISALKRDFKMDAT
ncbi:serine/threonine-protein kinase [Pleionea sp. CnH1-48]|uniref:serine/threonine protein kinase n=1 Tax=Pleionea sp. CnH1-48 TaxID=2954494 RepID=UPI002098498E|nr:serine/threonine-protein kinase [Pleionea sp. CnH1-48]MCO7225180.1 serine/threonine protein kinase [Pleionea sp. CnH1-48]